MTVFQAVPHSLASHHHVWRGPGPSAEVVVRRSESGVEPSAGISPVGMFYSNGSPVFYPSGRAPRGRQAEASSSLRCPLLLRPGVSPVAEGSAREPGSDVSPTSSVLSSPCSPYPPHPLRSRSGRSHREEEENDEPTYNLSPHTRRSLAIQEAYKKVRDKKRRRRESEEAELDEGAGPGGGRAKDDERGGGAGGEGSSGGSELAV